jgi:hypothetical protein
MTKRCKKSFGTRSQECQRRSNPRFQTRKPATDRLNWVRLALRIFQGPGGDAENKNKATQILKAAVPALEKIRDEHQSERLRNTAAKYLERIAREVG